MPNPSLTQSQRKYLRELGHKLKPVIQIGDAGLSDALFNEFDATIGHHELIKVKVRGVGRAERDRMIDDLCRRGGAILVMRIGNTALVYRHNPEQPRIRLPARDRHQ